MSKRPRKSLDGLTYEEFRKQVKQGRVESLYLFVGEEEYLHSRALKALYGTVDESTRAFNIALYSIGESVGGSSGARITAASVIDAANQMPMIAARRIVVVRDFEKIKDNDLEAVLGYLKRPAPSATMVFSTQALDQRRKISDALCKACTVVLMDHPPEAQIARWAEEYLKYLGCRIDKQALNELISLVGDSMNRMACEMDKLAAYSKAGMVDSNAVKELVPRAREHSNFELWDALIGRDQRRAMRLIGRLLDDGGEPVMIVGVLAGLYRRMLLAKDMLAQRVSTQDISKATGQYGQRGAVFNAKVGRLSREEIAWGLRRIAAADNAIKGAMATPRLQIEYLVAELTLPDAHRWGIVP